VQVHLSYKTVIIPPHRALLLKGLH